jgi:hypothetical protein
LKHSGSIRGEFGVNSARKRGGPHHSVIFVNLARIQPNSAEYRGFDPPD